MCPACLLVTLVFVPAAATAGKQGGRALLHRLEVGQSAVNMVSDLSNAVGLWIFSTFSPGDLGRVKEPARPGLVCRY